MNDAQPTVLTHCTMKEAMMVSIPSVTQLAAKQHARNNRRAFTMYMAGRPTPVDMFERILLRLDWIMYRMSSRP